MFRRRKGGEIENDVEERQIETEGMESEKKVDGEALCQAMLCHSQTIPNLEVLRSAQLLRRVQAESVARRSRFQVWKVNGQGKWRQKFPPQVDAKSAHSRLICRVWQSLSISRDTYCKDA